MVALISKYTKPALSYYNNGYGTLS